MVDRLLALQPASDLYAFELFAVIRQDLLGATPAPNGQTMEDKLIAALAHSSPLVVPAAKVQPAPAAALFSQFDGAPDCQESIRQALESQQHALSAPVAQEKLAELRRQFTPFIGEALLGVVYASLNDLSGGQVAALPQLTRQHELSVNPWGRAEFDPAKKLVRGSVAQAGLALAASDSYAPGVEGKSAGKSVPSMPITAATRQAQHLVDGRKLTLRAAEYVVRSLDLGEDVIALSEMRFPAAERTLNSGLRDMLSPRRAAAVQKTLDQGGVKQAIEMLTPSELYFLGQRFLTVRRQETPLSELANEPGSLGAMARILKDAQMSGNSPAMAGSLANELRQFGMPVTTRAGLARLELSELEPYEHAMSFADADRLGERTQDLKLTLARASYRHISSATLAQTAGLVREFLKDVAKNTREAAGGTAQAEGDWEGLLLTLDGRLAENTLRAFLGVLGRSAGLRALPDSRWNEGMAPAGANR